MKIYHWLASTAENLSKNLKIDLHNSYFEAYCILEKALEKPKNQIIAHLQAEIPEDKINDLNSLINRRLAHEPLQYIIEEWQFLDLKIKVGPGVLIPRPETEEWVANLLIPYITTKYNNQSFTLVDVCTGSGVIGLSVLTKFINSKVIFIDISPSAIKYCKYNIEFNNKVIHRDIINNNFLIIQSNLTSCINSQSADIVVANPPYIKSSQLKSLQKEIADFEPVIALDGGSNGLVIIQKILNDVPRILKKGGRLYCEHSHDQVNELFSITPKELRIVSTYTDYSNNPRCTVWELN